jgi:hypothetical protein
MYALVNFRGVKHIFLPSVWKLKIPPRVQVFLWLFSQNKVMTRYNLRKRGMPKPLECSLCKEIESVKHLFFECLVSELLWDLVFDVFGIRVTDFLSIASRWLCNTRHLQFNFVSSAILWSIWNNRNSIVFNRKTWLNMKQVWQLALSYLRSWKTPFKNLRLDESGSICRDVDSKTQEAVGTDAGMICKSFGWIISWSLTAAGAQHGGRALMAYLQAHPDDESVHVVMG